MRLTIKFSLSPYDPRDMATTAADVRSDLSLRSGMAYTALANALFFVRVNDVTTRTLNPITIGVTITLTVDGHEDQGYSYDQVVDIITTAFKDRKLGWFKILPCLKDCGNAAFTIKHGW